MAEPQKTPFTLAEVLMIPVVQPLIKKPLLGKQRLPLAAFLSVGGFLFETGAILGWAYRDSQLSFVRVIALPETPDQRVKLMRLKAKERVKEWKSPDDSFFKFVYETEAARRGHPIDMRSEDMERFMEDMVRFMKDKKRFMEDKKRFMEDMRSEDMERFMKYEKRFMEDMKRFTNWLKKQSLDLHTAWSELHVLFYEGIGYGFEFPEETQRRWKAVYEKPKTPDDLISWREAYKYGAVSTTEPPPIQTWDERVSELKDVLRGYITEFKPALNTLFSE